MANPTGKNQYTRSPGAIARSQLLPKPKSKAEPYARAKANDRSVAAGGLKWGRQAARGQAAAPANMGQWNKVFQSSFRAGMAQAQKRK
mgnify:CR=1 FL=1